MLGFFVVPYEEECFYSLVARFCKLIGSIPSGFALLFGNSKQRIFIRTDLASDLTVMAPNLSWVFPHSSEEIYNKFTLWPLYKKFVSLDKFQKVQMNIISGGDKVSLMLGTSAIESGLVPLYCPACNKAQIDSGKEIFWNRIHQTPNILICPYHHCYLERALFPVTGSKDALFIPSLASCPVNVPRQCENQALIDISETLMKLLIEPKKHPTLNHREGLVQLNYMKQSFINFELLQKDFEEVLQGLTSTRLVGVKQSRKYLSRSLFDDKLVFKPASHVAVQVFFDIKRLTKIETKISCPFGNGPWECLNPCCPKFNRNSIATCKWHYYKKSNKHIGYFTCDCQLEYRKVINIKKGSVKVEILHYGKLWEDEALDLLKQGLAKQVIARKIGYTVNSGIRAVDKIIGINPLRGRNSIKKTFSVEEINKLRKSWEDLVYRKIKIFSISKIRNENPALYRCLNNYDKEWLKDFNKGFSQAKNRVRVIAINEDRILEQIKEEIKIIKKQFPPTKITLKRISLGLGFSLTSKHMKMPRLMNLLKAGLESSAEFQERERSYELEIS